MQVDLFRRVIAGAFVMTMGVVAALPYHRTPPPLAQLDQDEQDPFRRAAEPLASANVSQATFGIARPNTTRPPANSPVVHDGNGGPSAPGTNPVTPPAATTHVHAARPAGVSPLVTRRHAPDRPAAANQRASAPTITSDDARRQTAPTLRVAAGPAGGAGVLDPMHEANPIVEHVEQRMEHMEQQHMGRPSPSEISTPSTPPMASQFPSTLTPNVVRPMAPVHLDATSRASSGASPSGLAIGHAPASPPPARGATRSTPQASKPRKYVIRDGDTLSNIAARLLGTPDRAGEIYQMNRARLPSPQILPLGIEILVPPERAPTPGPNGMAPVYIDIGT